MTEAPRVHNNHNVYILGAGFSRAAGYPLTSDFMAAMRACLPSLERQPGRSKEIDAIRTVLALRLEAAGAAHRTHLDPDNVEELFSLASALDGDRYEEPMGWAIAATLDYARALWCHRPLMARVRLMDDKIPPRYDGSRTKDRTGAADSIVFLELYQALAGVLADALVDRPGGSRNTVITFNYDTLLEDGLESLGLHWGYSMAERTTSFRTGMYDERMFGPDRGPQILKLHGSVNWSVAESLRIFPSYAALREAGAAPYLVPPTWRRKYGSQCATDPLDRVWREAVKALETATNIVIAGFSLPFVDVHFRYLMSAGLKNNISLSKIHVFKKDVDLEYVDRVYSVLRRELEKREVVHVRDRKAEDELLCRPFLASIGREDAPGTIDPILGWSDDAQFT